MITKFKIFENNQKEKFFYDVSDLIEILSQKFIEDYYEEHWEHEIEDAIHLNLWNYVDIDTVRGNLINQLSDEINIRDKRFSKSDYVIYINDHMNGEDDFNKMSIEQLIEIIEDEGNESDFIKRFLEEEYEDEHPNEILMEIYGKHFLDSDENIYSVLKNYINKDKLIEDYKGRIEFETKLEYIEDFISRDEELQRMLLNMNQNTSEALFDVMEEDKSIGIEYDFQKMYIDTMTKHEATSEDVDEILPELLENIDEKFGLHPKIIKDYPKGYKDYLMKKDAERYNI
jgi:hypothetical protein